MSTVRALIRHPADQVQVGLALLGPAALSLPFLISFSLELEILLWGVVWLFICRNNYILHNHVHRPFTSSRTLNRLLAILLGFCTGMTAGIWKITHVHGHHVEHKIDVLPSRGFVRRFDIRDTDYSYLGAIRHAFRTAPLQLALPVMIMIWESFRERSFRRTFYRYHLLEFCFIYGLVLGFFIIQPIKAFLYFGMMYSVVYLISRHVDYVTHVCCAKDSEHGFANVCVHPRYNKFLWNFGYHTAHHLKPAAHWTTLPSIHKELDLIEKPQPSAKTVNYFGIFSPAVFEWYSSDRPRGHS
jgi:fatty acid desaturase